MITVYLTPLGGRRPTIPLHRINRLHTLSLPKRSMKRLTNSILTICCCSFLVGKSVSSVTASSVVRTSTNAVQVVDRAMTICSILPETCSSFSLDSIKRISPVTPVDIAEIVKVQVRDPATRMVARKPTIEYDPSGLVSLRLIDGSDAIAMHVAALGILAVFLVVGAVVTPAMDAWLLVESTLVTNRSFVARQAMCVAMITDHEFAVIAAIVSVVWVCSLRRISCISARCETSVILLEHKCGFCGLDRPRLSNQNRILQRSCHPRRHRCCSHRHRLNSLRHYHRLIHIRTHVAGETASRPMHARCRLALQ